MWSFCLRQDWRSWMDLNKIPCKSLIIFRRTLVSVAQYKSTSNNWIWQNQNFATVSNETSRSMEKKWLEKFVTSYKASEDFCPGVCGEAIYYKVFNGQNHSKKCHPLNNITKCYILGMKGTHPSRLLCHFRRGVSFKIYIGRYSFVTRFCLTLVPEPLLSGSSTTESNAHEKWKAMFGHSSLLKSTI